MSEELANVQNKNENLEEEINRIVEERERIVGDLLGEVQLLNG